MSVTRSKQLCLVHISGGGTHTVYAVPPGYVTLVKHLQVVNSHSTAVYVEIQIQNPGLGTGGMYLFAPALAQYDRLGGDCWFVLGDGDEIHVYTDAGNLDVLAAGAELPA